VTQGVRRYADRKISHASCEFHQLYGVSKVATLQGGISWNITAESHDVRDAIGDVVTQDVAHLVSTVTDTD